MTVTNRRTHADALLALLQQTSPSTWTNRQFAEALGIHIATVKRVIRTLDERGYITIERRYPDPAAGDPAGRTLTVRGGAQ